MRLYRCSKCRERKPRAAFLNGNGYQCQKCDLCRDRASAPAEPEPEPAAVETAAPEAPPETPRCSKCGRRKPAEEFVGPDGGLFKTCAACRERQTRANHDHYARQAAALARKGSLFDGCPFASGACRPAIGPGLPDGMAGALIDPFGEREVWV